MFKNLLSFFLSLSLMLSGGLATAAGGKSVIQIADTGKVSVGSPFKVSARVTDPDGVDVVRLYFKAPHTSDYSFVELQPQNGDYVGTLPAPAAGTSRVEQLVLVKDGSGNISQSRFFDTATSIAKTGTGSSNGTVVVYSEVTPKPASLDGFTGKYVIKSVPESQKLGVVAGLVKGKATGTGSSKAAEPPAVEEKKRLSTAAIAGIAGGAVALIAVAAGGGGGGDSSSSGGQAELFGDVQVQLRWSNTADVDLHVTDPCGNRIDHLQRSAVCQGFTGSLDRNANDESDPNPSTTPEENITWPNGAPRGHYSIRVRMQDDRGNGPTQVTVDIKDGDQPINESTTTIGAAEGSSAYTGFDF